MVEIKRDYYGIRPRIDSKPGYMVITPTMMKFYEQDGSDVRLDRVRVYDPNGTIERILLMDKMGAPFVDIPAIADDLEFLQK